jgi:hypothetical protein
MLGSDQPEQTIEDGVFSEAEAEAEAEPACVALVPVVASAQWSIPSQLSRPNSTFVTHLIATAEQVPQTRSLRRATAADAQTAYSVNRHALRGAGLRTRQII